MNKKKKRRALSHNFFMKDEQFQKHITNTPSKLLKIYGVKELLYRNYSPIDPEASHRMLKEPIESRCLIVKMPISQHGCLIENIGFKTLAVN
jgi:hypothetical protein